MPLLYMRHFSLFPEVRLLKKQALIASLVIVSLIFNGTMAVAQSTDRFADELWYLSQISATETEFVSSGSETIVAVLDAGFDLDHEDLEGQYWVNVDETVADQVDNDANGYEDDVMGWDFVDNDPDPSPDTTAPLRDIVVSHGTVIAGIIAAKQDNGLGIRGIAPEAKIMPLRVLNRDGAGSTVDVRRAVRYAVENGADIINLSITFSTSDERLRETLVWAYEQGVVIVGAVGNGNVDTDSTPIYPACYDQEIGHNVVIGVAASDRSDNKASFSNFGTRCVDLVAPGVDIFATVFHDASELLLSTAYASPWEGTSLAAPIVAAAAARLRSTYPSMTPDQVRNALKLSVDPVGESSLEARTRLGAGRLNLAKALEVAQVTVQGTGATSVSSGSVIETESFVIAQGHGSVPLVRRYDGRGNVLGDFHAYSEAFTGGVRVATGDVDGDGELEIVTGAGPGGGPQVRVFDLDGRPENQFFAFDEGGRGGIYVATGDINADGIDEIIVTADQNSTGQVRIFNKLGHLKGSFFPLGRTETPLAISAGNLDADAEDELIVTKRYGSDGAVRIFDGTGTYVRSFVAFDGDVDAITTTVGDLDGDGVAEIVVASGSGHSPKVSVYNQLGTLTQSFFAYHTRFTGGVSVAVGDIDNNGLSEIYTSPLASGGPHVRIFDQSFDLIGGFFTFDQEDRYGTFIAM